MLKSFPYKKFMNFDKGKMKKQRFVGQLDME